MNTTMNTTLDFLTGNRKWLIRDYQVWGDSGSFDGAILITEKSAPSNRVIFMYELSGGNDQVVEFTDLIDHRGNRLPSTIKNAEVIIIPKNDGASHIIGDVGPSSFRIARRFDDPSNAIADLLIMEMN